MESWWRGALIYQIYPRSFFDTNQDGIGDIKGITQKLDYIHQLNVDMIWISPFYPSPMKDFGYDISDHKNVHPMFGNLSDFEILVSEANKLGIKVMIDLVLSHTSDQHPWFQQSRSSKDNSKADWYVWSDPKPDGTPPNNWLSIFGGSAWAWDTTRRQFYMHNFLTSQPDLNFHNPTVVDAIKDIVGFWLKLGVHGVRLDTVNWYFHDIQLRDNPPSCGGVLLYSPESSNYQMQEHIFNKSRPEMLPFLEDIRKLLDRYSAIALGELTAKAAVEMTPKYTQKDKRLHMVYTFGLLTNKFNPTEFKQTVREVEASLNDGWICWALSNHDVIRVVSRWQIDGVPPAQWAKFLLGLLLSLRGSICLYQGEELGLPEADISFEDIQDPFGKTMWPEFKGRDGCRTPMPWQSSAPNAGFSTVKTWLPIPNSHVEKAVELQERDEDSVLNFSRNFIKWRQSQPALKHGSITILKTSDTVIAFERKHEDDHILAVFNSDAHPQTIDLTAYGQKIHSIPVIGAQGNLDNQTIHLPACSIFFARIS